jgi:hypothetical protein
MKILTKDQKLAAEDLKKEPVEVPEWGGAVIVSTMTGAARDAFEYEVYGMKGEDKNIENIRAKIVAAAVVDENGDPMFKGSADVVALGRKSVKALDRVFTVAKRLNGIGAKDMEELEKNLPAVPSGSSISS